MLQPRIPVHLGDRFSVADALQAGVSASRLRKSDLDSPFFGVRRRSETEPDDMVVFNRFGKRRGEKERAHIERALDYATRAGEHEFFCHVTAAILWDLPLPSSLLISADIHVAVLAPRRLPRGKGVRGHQAVSKLTKLQRDPRTGLLLADPATTWAMLASIIHHSHDIVAVADAIVREWRAEPLATTADLERAILCGRRVGIDKLREALPLVRTHSASRPETRTRLELLDARLPGSQLRRV